MGGTFLNLDCMDNEQGLPAYSDNYFDLAIVDPPYGVGQHFNFRYSSVYDNNAPNKRYFSELLRVSKNQIVWGGNYFTDKLPISRGWIAWFKDQPVPHFSDFELAWTSFDMVTKKISLASNGARHPDKRLGYGGTIHPSQKPIVLYQELLRVYATSGAIILDTHVGSASSLIACESMEFNYVGFEISDKYFERATRRMLGGVQKTLL